MKLRIVLLLASPFISFFGAYFIVRALSMHQTFDTPNVMGMPLDAATKKLVHHHLNIRLIGERIDDHLQPGTVIEQDPPAGQPVRPNQSIYLLLSKQSDKPLVPNLKGRRLAEIQKIAQEHKVRLKIHRIPLADTVHESCLFHIPVVGEPFLQELQLYLAVKPTEEMVVNNLHGMTLAQVARLTQQKGIELSVHHLLPQDEWYKPEDLIVINQQPCSGTILATMQHLQVTVTQR